MLIKRIYILKGKGCSGILKVKNLEGAYCEIELNVYNTPMEETFILKVGSYVFVENLEDCHLKRKIRCIEPDNVYSAICSRKTGSIVMWAGEGSTPPNFLIELASKQKYPIIIKKEEKDIEKKTDVRELIEDISSNIEDFTLEKETVTNQSLLEESREEEDLLKNDSEIQEEEEKGLPQSIEEKFGITSISSSAEISEDVKGDPQGEEKVDFKLALAKEILEKYNMVEHNEDLERLCRESKWIIETTSEKDFSLGVLFNSDGDPTHVCYATKGTRSNPPDYTSQWLSSEEEEGYWVVYEEIE